MNALSRPSRGRVDKHAIDSHILGGCITDHETNGGNSPTGGLTTASARNHPVARQDLTCACPWAGTRMTISGPTRLAHGNVMMPRKVAICMAGTPENASQAGSAMCMKPAGIPWAKYAKAPVA
jgi:hypothetical protein